MNYLGCTKLSSVHVSVIPRFSFADRPAQQSTTTRTGNFGQIRIKARTGGSAKEIVLADEDPRA